MAMVVLGGTRGTSVLPVVSILVVLAALPLITPRTSIIRGCRIPLQLPLQDLRIDELLGGGLTSILLSISRNSKITGS